ncbi:MAG: bifunctional (p)ppGpp synthetase/guanosine-3',5'-bis(diphosphate) 3'-pyrophosphohydrolase [Alphaproteobacteria bacterium]|nr:bifunctional (p)ppGpp synthetase/guanosine-3',5'-bis(diphosphate) 3'-pyrophosphohydrolase [Alphaproteobacteria bacterium]
MLSCSDLISHLRAYHPNLDESLIKRAYFFARDAHGNQKRHSGDPYFSHPVAVAEILIKLKLDQESIVTALLHDVAEDTEVTLEEIEKEFGEEVARLVDGVTKLGRIESVPVNERLAENFRKLTLAMSEDIRVLLVKLADRLHNMRTLFYVPSQEKKIKKARESLDIYAQLAGRIGLNKIKDELQDIAFAVIDQEARNQIVAKLGELREHNKNIVEKIIDDLRQIMLRENIECEISGREKKPYSIWTKIKKQNVGFHNLHDVMAFRVVTKNISECYRVLGVINSHYSMIPGSFRDYISTPKENGYMSLHLAILGPFGHKIEIQIRDQEMHETAELGVAAHWHYKEKFSGSNRGIASKAGKENQQYVWVRELIQLFENSENSNEALKDYKLSLHKDEVFCFTPNGDIFNLILGATAIDFAYAIHSDIGNSCVSAKINGMIVPLRHQLSNGDQVEIITAKNSKPSPNWLQFATTSKARSAIKHFIRSEKSNEYQALGRAILSKFFAARNLPISDKILEKILPNFHKKSVVDLYVRVADGTISRQDVLKVLYPDFKEEVKPNKLTPSKKIKSDYYLPIDGLVSGMAIHYAGCCNPIPGDPIIGIINTGTGVTIHNQICHNLKNLVLLPQRMLAVCWKSEDEIGDEFYASRVRVVVENKSGGIADVTSIIAKKKINISNIRTTNRSADVFEMMIDLEVHSLEHLEEILSALRISKKILEVERVSG